MKGGTLVLYGLVSHSLDIAKHSQTHGSGSNSVYTNLPESLEAQHENNSSINKFSWITGNQVFQVVLLIWALFGASCVISDGILTPAVSVICATNGIFFHPTTSNVKV